MSSAGTAGPGQLGLTLPQPGDMYNRMLQIQEIRNAANQNALFQQTFQAKQLAGQIMAQAPDVATGLKNLQSDPRTAAFAPEILGQYRQIELTNQQIAGEQQKQYSSGFHDLAAALPSAYIPANADLGTFRSTMLARLGSMPESVRNYLSENGVIDNLQHALFDNLPKDPAAAQQAYTQRMNALMLGADFKPDQIQQAIGKPENISTGGGTILGQRSPYGGYTPMGTVSNTLAPTTTTGPYGPGGAQTTQIIGGQPGVYTPIGANPLNPGAGVGAPAAPANALGATPPNLTGPTQSQSAAYTKIGDTVGQIQEDMNSDARELPTQIKRLDTLTDALGQFQAGGGAPTRASIAKVMQALKNAGIDGITDDEINKVANGSLPATQIFMKNVVPLLTQEMRENATASSTRIRAEVEGFLKMMDASTDPRALVKMLNNIRYSLQLGYDQSQKWPQYKQDVNAGKIPGYGMEDFYSYYDKNLRPKDLPKSTPGGLRLAPVPESSAKGVVARPLSADEQALVNKYGSIGGQ